jgi:hypothetical protein
VICGKSSNMPAMKSSPHLPFLKRLGRVHLGWALGSALGLSIVPHASEAEPEKEARYPYDPACPWGRLSNGKGMIHRCLSEDEARRLVVGPATTPSPDAGATKATGAAAPPAEPSVEKSPDSPTVPVDRYRACIDENGGLEATRGKVVVSFLVQAARSRAEGVEVSRVAGLSKKAAQCIADVIDRRRVGTPTEETTGVELTIELTGK